MSADAAVLVPDADTLHVIIGDVFNGLLGDGEPLRPLGAPSADSLPVQARVSVRGGWNGCVVVSCSAPLARLVTAQLLLTPDAELADDDLCDVVGELANVIGGNVKSVMPGPSVLSLPQSTLTAAAGTAQPPAESEATSVRLAWREQPLEVSVWTAHDPDEKV